MMMKAMISSFKVNTQIKNILDVQKREEEAGESDESKEAHVL